MGRVGLVLHIHRGTCPRRLRRHFDDLASHIQLPAMVEAAHPSVLVAPELKRGSPVRAIPIHQADVAIGVAPGKQVLPEKADIDRITIGMQDFLGQHGWHPMPTHQPAHGGIAFNATKELVLFGSQHDLIFTFSKARLAASSKYDYSYVSNNRSRPNRPSQARKCR